MAERILPDWLAAYLKYTENTEPPTSYHTWVGISMIAAVLQRKVWMYWGHEKIFPNLYVILIGPSGRCRKGTAMNIGKNLVDNIKTTTLISENITREALIKVMRGSLNNFANPSKPGEIIFHSSVTAISEELSVFLGQNDIRFLAALTNWYDSRDRWTYETKNAGVDVVQGVCFNLLGGTAPDWIRSMLPQEAIGGGFTSRCIFIVEENKAKIISNPNFLPMDERLRTALIKDLEQISLLAGEYTFDAQTIALYDKWYNEQEAAITKGSAPVDDPRFAGYCERRATHVKKIAMILSAARRNSRIVQVEDFNNALGMLKGAEIKMPRVFSMLGRSRYAEVTQMVLEYLMVRGKATRSELLINFYRDVDTLTLRLVEEVLEQMKVVKIVRDVMNNEVIYEYTGMRRK